MIGLMNIIGRDGGKVKCLMMMSVSQRVGLP